MSRFNRQARLDPSQVQDRRGSTGMKIGGIGGGAGLIILVVALLLGVNPLDSGSSSQFSSNPGVATVQGSSIEDCQTGADANEERDCRIVGYVNSIQDYWTTEFSQRGSQYQASETILFTDATQSGCGMASSAVGPFYCPRDQDIYLDLGFFQELQTRFGAQGGPFVEAYVLAHEYGHHVQDLAGTLEQANSQATGPESDAVRVELQADCYAGLWAHHATETGYIAELTETDIRSGLDAAAAIGDDRIQERLQGQVSPESWTHGSSEQRQRWFLIGYQTGELESCDTFRSGI